VRNEQLYLISNLDIAAFLCMMGYTLLGAVDTGTERKEFALTHTRLKDDPSAMKDDILQKTQQFDVPFKFLEHPNTVSFKEYDIKLRMCKRSLQFPIKIESLREM
jgi:hypothetical protein